MDSVSIFKYAKKCILHSRGMYIICQYIKTQGAGFILHCTEKWCLKWIKMVLGLSIKIKYLKSTANMRMKQKLTALSIPNIIIVTKNKQDQTCEPGRVAIASG